MRRHWSWLIPLLVAVTSLTTLILLPVDGRGALYVLLVVVSWVLFAVFLTAMVITVVNAVRLRRSRRRRARAEIAARETRKQAETVEAWREACDLLVALARGTLLPALTVWGPVLNPGEQAFLDTVVYGSRYYGGDGAYVHVNSVFVGPAPFMVFGMAATAMGNSARRNAAAADVVRRWRDPRQLRIIVTNYGFLCFAEDRWHSFAFRLVSGFYPEPLNWSVVFTFSDGIPPLRLDGEGAPAVAVLSAWAMGGQAWLRDHPALEPLRPVRHSAH
ncbi:MULTISPECIES: hypothetical protein [unclassified Pseudofrankia]|uniref:hypothetical protein n=1 Tax=unclassified Pseudofrankia TaxID=2994372 RepID=UPI0008DA0F9F|nr:MULTISPECIES: hypothetical protein [unclassified Pseudofrankia]MDT3440696.1 hypothetical protein [Pseudofrankia sp. BMG5.37]OHV58903.1 hypothetical protein BCD48_05665 [Pseudofrankia sp. BMG5.36]